jgi:hypothetical protein
MLRTCGGSCARGRQLDERSQYGIFRETRREAGVTPGPAPMLPDPAAGPSASVALPGTDPLRGSPMYLSILILLLSLLAGTRSGAAQADRPASVSLPATVVEQAEPAPADSVLVLEATVVRTSRSASAGGATSGDMLVRLGSGDTLRVSGVDPLPGVGASVSLRGRMVAADGAVALVGEDGPIRPTVLRPGATWEADARAPLVSRCTEPRGVTRAWCAVASFPPWLLALGGLTILAALAALWAGFRPGAADDDGSEIPLIVDLDAAREAVGSAGTVRAGAGSPRDAEPAEVPAGGAEPAPVAPEPEARVDTAARSPRRQPDEPLPTTAHHPPFVRVAGVVNGAGTGASSHQEPAGPENVRSLVAASSAPAPATAAEPVAENARLQLLPGVFEVEAGPGLGPELRFFRVTSMEDAVITLGRDEGEPYRHVRLDAPTVSRIHARIRFADRRWTIANLSVMNPVVVNAEELGADEDEVVLDDGDRIRIGEFVFRYRDARRR